MKIELGKKYKTRNGRVVEIDGYNPGALYCFTGMIERSIFSWRENGQYLTMVEKSDDDLVSEAFDVKAIVSELYSGWMCSTPGSYPMPCPTEEIARAWALKSGGRAFRVVEVLE
jgi:hypothetical protein